MATQTQPGPFVVSPDDPLADAHAAVAAAIEERGGGTVYQEVSLKNLPIGQRLLKAKPPEQRRYLLAALAQARYYKLLMDQRETHYTVTYHWNACEVVTSFVRRDLSLDHDDLAAAVEWCAHNFPPLEFPSERITVRELIRERVYQEVQDYNRRQGERYFCGLVQPAEAECVLNGRQNEYRLKPDRQINWKEQFEKAVEAFSRNGFFILVDDKQAESLDQEVVIRAGTQVSFVKLTLLVGG